MVLVEVLVLHSGMETGVEVITSKEELLVDTLSK